jgi:hypothetical protein
MSTPLFAPVASLMFVGPDSELRQSCSKSFPGVQQTSVGHAAAALVRMLVLRPLAVVVDESLSADDIEQIVERARDIRAEVVRGTRAHASDFVGMVQKALRKAERSRELPAGTQLIAR